MRNRCHSIRSQAGFTLVEMFVTLAILAGLAALAFPAYQAAMMRGQEARETGAARNLIAAYLQAAADNNGILLSGKDQRVRSVPLPDGTTYSMAIACQRYPLRLAPYFGWDVDHVTMINPTVRKQLQQVPAYSQTYYYLESVFPALGINYNFVGGSIDNQGRVAYAPDCVTRLTREAGAPIIVFASSGTGVGISRIDGYDTVTPPQVTGPRWSDATWKPDVDPGNFGNVCARYDGHAVCAFTDGSVAMRGIDELRDMRLWSAQAAMANDPDYQITSSVYAAQ